MLRSLQLVFWTALTTLVITSSADALAPKAVLRASDHFSLTRVTTANAEALGTHQQSALGYGESASDSSLASRAIAGVRIPGGVAAQATSKAAMAARTQVEGGARLYRVGTTGTSNATGAQFWALEHPLTPGFAARHGIPAANVANANFIQTAVLKPGSNFVTRVAPGVGSNPGGAIEVVVPEGGALLQSFSIIR